MLKHSDLRAYKIDLIIWCDTDIKQFGFATAGLGKPNNLPFASEKETKSAARALIKQARNKAVENGTMTIDSNLFIT